MEAIAEIFLVLTGKVVVTLLSLGRWRGESWTGNESQIHAAAGALSFVLDGRRVITATGLMMIGLLFYVGLFGAVSWFLFG